MPRAEPRGCRIKGEAAHSSSYSFDPETPRYQVALGNALVREALLRSALLAHGMPRCRNAPADTPSMGSNSPGSLSATKLPSGRLVTKLHLVTHLSAKLCFVPRC